MAVEMVWIAMKHMWYVMKAEATEFISLLSDLLGEGVAPPIQDSNGDLVII